MMDAGFCTSIILEIKNNNTIIERGGGGGVGNDHISLNTLPLLPDILSVKTLIWISKVSYIFRQCDTSAARSKKNHRRSYRYIPLLKIGVYLQEACDIIPRQVPGV